MTVRPSRSRRFFPDLAPGSKARVVVFTALGTLCCIVVAFAVDSRDWDTGAWRWGDQPLNNLIIPLLLAPPFFLQLLNRQRQLAIAHHELMVVAATDPLTSCLNRRAFTALVDGYLDRMESQEDATAQGALLIIDIDHFKDINDTHGHDAGDSALIRIAETIRSSVREFDAVGRMGGEEFSVLLPSVSEERANALAESIRTRIAATELMLSGRACHVSVSIGGVTFTHDTSFGELYRQADRKLYEAKQAGRDRTLFNNLATGADRVPVH